MITPLGSNQTEVKLPNGDKVLISYSTPVAACLIGVYYRTSKKHSATTTKHINKWIKESPVTGDKVADIIMDQDFFDGILEIGHHIKPDAVIDKEYVLSQARMIEK